MAGTVGQGIYKKLAYKKQTGLGSPASGSGGQYLRRETATFKKTNATYTSDEITSYQQYTGDSYGPGQTAGEINGLLSPKTYADLLGSLNRSAFAAVSAITGLSLTIAGTGPFTLTRGTGSFLTDGVKIGDVVRITAGTYTGVASNLNLLVTNVTALALTVMVPNGKVLSAQGPIASSTLTIVGKKSVTPDTGQANDYYTFEEWFGDLSRSRTWPDSQIAKAEIAIPATGNATIKVSTIGLARTKGSTQVLTSPATETTTAHMTAVNAVLFLAGTQMTVATSLNVTIDGQLTAGDPVIASPNISDVIKGDIKVSGTVTVQYQDETVSNNFDNQTAITISAVLFADTSDTSDFIGITIPRAKLFSDDPDDGKKQIVMTMNYTAERNGAGGSGISTDAGIISLQDSAA
jgi:hypothetical protein